MRLIDGLLISSPTDLANFLTCRHKTGLDLLVAQGWLAKPEGEDPLAEVMRQRGVEHERRYVKGLSDSGLTIVDLDSVEPHERLAPTIDAMRSGADVVVQATLADESWIGHADVLRKVNVPSPAFGGWSYEVYDTKLTRETRGSSILQLCVYSELLRNIQQSSPEYFYVVTPAGTERYRFEDFGAFYRQTRARFGQFTAARLGNVAARGETSKNATYPDPVEHCGVCRWYPACNAQRRKDDHLTFVAGLGRLQEDELEGQGIETLTALAGLPVPLSFKPSRGSKDTYERLQRQATLQLQSRGKEVPLYELLDPEEPKPGAAATNVGLAQLPEPDPADLFLDLEGDVFGRRVEPGPSDPGAGTRDYLFGLGRRAADGSFMYVARWALTDAQERTAFESVVDEIVATAAAHPKMHIYHYGHYEPSAFKRLMGRYASRGAEVDSLLRAGRFVDLHRVVRRGLRAGVEHYSIKDLESLYGFDRAVTLEQASTQRRALEFALETNDLPAATPAVRAVVEGYNRDDCHSTLELRNWLEGIRAGLIATGVPVPRPEPKSGEGSANVTDRQARVDELRPRLLHDVPVEVSAQSPEQHARYLLAYCLDWHRRESKAVWWDYFRLIELDEDDLLDERKAIAGLEFVEHVGPFISEKTGRPTGSVVDRYKYPPQDMDIRRGAALKTQAERAAGEVLAVERTARTLEIKKGKSIVEPLPSVVFEHTYIRPDVVEDAIYRVATHVAAVGSVEACELPAMRNLLLRRPPVALAGEASADRSPVDYLVELVHRLDGDVLAVQGPPGSGKTFSGARMICSLVGAGRRVGVTATSHKVIRNLLDAVEEEARKQGVVLHMIHKKKEDEDDGPADRSGSTMTEEVRTDDEALARLVSRDAQVVGGTAWFWANEDFAQPDNHVDVLFVDEAGQMSLANVLAVSQATRNLVLLGDPQQLEQPQKGSHPDGVDVSVLQHILGPHQTMPADRGIMLPVTWRLSPEVCAFTSEVFYEGRLSSKPGLENQRLHLRATEPVGDLNGAGLWFLPVEHDGNRNASDQEVDAVVRLVDQLLASGSTWLDEESVEQQLTPDDIVIVAPYNAQVGRLQERLPGMRVGTVDKFQGQEAPVVIYSMATSRPEDAPRGMEFLYSLNRLNVATSRARCACIVVASPRLLEPECSTPRQMQLANALARYKERSR